LLTLDYGGLDHAYTPEELAFTRAVTKLAALLMERERLLVDRSEAQADALAWRAAHQRMVELIELAHDAVIVRDPASRIVYWNQGAECLYGWNTHEALGQITHSLLSTHFPSSREAVEAHLSERGCWEGMLTHTSRDGEPLVVESRQVLVRNNAGEPEAILEINRDITEPIVQEREEARAHALAAHEATRRMDELIGIVSHELKTPLTSINGNLQLARRRVPTAMDEVQGEDEGLLRKLEGIQILLDRAERQVSVQSRLVSDLVDVARIQTDKLELHLAMTDLATIVREVVEDQRIAAPLRLIVFETVEPAVRVRADGERIGQVVSNYLSNALKYAPADSPIAVRLAVQGELARVEVADEGPGLSAAQQVRIWERFYRVPEIQVQSGTGVGLGLGLHICQMIIEQHQGAVGVQSTQGAGSIFWFTLPLWREHDNDPES
jgi:PAS domain S-box-containing protein